MKEHADHDPHVFKAPEIAEIRERAITCFVKSPLSPFPPNYNMDSGGVYALYYFGDYDLYEPIAEKNRAGGEQPIYIGKAIASGKRTGMQIEEDIGSVQSRLSEHYQSISYVSNLNVKDFKCKFVFLGKEEEDFIEVLEARLIMKYQTLWNARCLSGFGIHAPGSGRIRQRRSIWDTLHPGRPFAMSLEGVLRDEAKIIENVKDFLEYGPKPKKVRRNKTQNLLQPPLL